MSLTVAYGGVAGLLWLPCVVELAALVQVLGQARGRSVGVIGADLVVGGLLCAALWPLTLVAVNGIYLGQWLSGLVGGDG